MKLQKNCEINMYSHKSVLLDESVKALRVKKQQKYIDATLGGGGHTSEILSLGGKVLGIDVDEDALRNAKIRFEIELRDKKLIIQKGNFKDIDILAEERGFDKVSGILFDLGVSSNQIDNPERGFSYQKSGPLDMRMDQELEVDAKDLINGLTKNELILLFNRFGDEYRAKDIADRIVREREKKPITSTDELVRLLAQSYKLTGDNDFVKAKSSKKVFQALRIAVNDEIMGLESAIPKAFSLLHSGGRICIISFHSLEDRVVKRKFKELEEGGFANMLTKKPIYPTEEEITNNSRSKSAKLRIIEKI